MRVALGVCGGIAAYKAAEIARLLQDRKAEVQVVMTRSAQEFVRPLIFAALTGHKVIADMFAGDEGRPNLDSAIEHISVAQAIDCLLVAPATANILAKFARGIADDFLTTLYLATTAPVIVAPAMNVNMWNHPATRENLAILKQRGVQIVEPDSGYLACGMVGAGRLAENEAIVEAVLRSGGARDLEGETVLITAGPTREAIDPVRYLSNRSSGKMGFALAEAALRRGAQVLLVTGPTALQPPAGAEVTNIESAAQMHDAVLAQLPRATVVIKAAAVADYRPASSAAQKIKREGRTSLTLELEATSDILSEVVRHASAQQLIIGFAAETNNAIKNARHKLQAKSVQAMVVNDVLQPGIGFDSDRNAVTIITADKELTVPESSKREVADQILNVVHRLRENKKASSAATE